MARDEIQITLTEDEIEKLKPSEEADIGPLTSNKPSDEIQITFNEDEIKKLKLLEEADAGVSTPNKPLIQEVTQKLISCYSSEECRGYFKPTSVAIGPLNHRKGTNLDSRIERGEKCKLKLAAMFINFSESTKEDFYKNVKKEIYRLKNCYDSNGVGNWNDEELAWMFLVDGCALLGFIALDMMGLWQEYTADFDLVDIEKVDLFLLENQLPYRLLEILIDSFCEVSSEESTENPMEINSKLFKNLITEFVTRSFLILTGQQQHQIQVDYSPPHPPHEQQQEEEDPPQHLLELLRRRLIGVKSKEKSDEEQKRINKDGFRKTLTGDTSEHWPSIRNVKELKDMGIRFKAREKGGAITDIDFKDHCCMPTLTLAPIFLHNTTVPLLLNLIAYELCPDFKETCKITSHLSFLDSLIDNGENVKELRDAGVLHNGLGSDEAVAKLFNRVSGILLSNLNIDLELRRNIHEYCNNKSHPRYLCATAMAKLIDTYFSSPWSFLVFLGVLAGLIMTGIQAYNSFRENKLALLNFNHYIY
ncbi:hypothetical protein SLA2020_260410 [Shorea laevis]